MEKVIVTLTTISTRIANVHRVIESLLQQSYPNFEVRLYVSCSPYLLDEGVSTLPESLKRLRGPRFGVHYTENTGPYRKLMPALMEFRGTNRLLVTVDDDVIYPKDFLATLVTAETVYRCPVAYRGRRITLISGQIGPYKSWKKTMLAGCKGENLPTGKDGVLYRPSYFHDAVLDLDVAMKAAATTDDLWFKWHTALAGYPSVLLFDSLSASFATTGDEGVSLFDSFNKHTNNDMVVQALELYAQQKHGITLARMVAE